MALALAEQSRGVIVNADSAQIYRDLPILSAAPTAEERARAEHRLYGVVDGATPCSAADWAAMAREEIAGIHESKRLPILVGGTGLYLRTLLDGIAPVPPIDADVRKRVREAPLDRNREELERLDPASAARLKPGDTARINRALEVVQSTGQTLSAWQQHREGGIGDSVDVRALILLPPRDWLYARCDERFAAMVARGAVAEIEALLARGLDPDLPVMRGIGVREIGAYLSGELSLAEAIAAGQQATRRYAKRQYTWFAHQPPAGWPRFGDPLDSQLSDPRWNCSAPKPKPRLMDMLHDADIDAAPLAGKRVAILGYGNQGRAQALNLHDSGIDVVVGLRGGSGSTTEAEAAGLTIALLEQAVASADVVMMLAPDEIHSALYAEIEQHLRRGAALGFSHGLSVRFGLVEPRTDLDVFMLAPKGPGTALRSLYTEGKGMIAVWAVAQDATGTARDIALA